VQLTPTEEDEAMEKRSLTVKQREQQVQHLMFLVTQLYQETGGRREWWQVAKRAISLSPATNARKAALQRQLDALTGNHSA
jgi:two-component SAPR family response regulator